MNNINPTIISVDTVNKFTQEDLTWSKKLNDPDQNDNNNSIYNHPHLYI